MEMENENAGGKGGRGGAERRGKRSAKYRDMKHSAQVRCMEAQATRPAVRSDSKLAL